MKKWFKLLAAVGLAALTLAGCGSGKDESSDPQAGASPTPPVVQATPQPEQKAKAVKVNAPDGLNIRSKASTDSEILGLAEDGSLLPLLLEEEQDGWYQVEYEGSPAYVSAEFAQVQEITMTEYNALRKGETSTDPAGPPPQAGDTDNSSSETSSQETSSQETSSQETSSQETSSSQTEETSSSQSESQSSSTASVDQEDGE